ncbi:phosphoribosylamine--glycine ligase [Desulfohalovibrio reitneri]|uniref:phosphoribosylamine--glycine ligase n=1 Tax=Desulfohalovibrio reitneri TaxID=1307759 RepID=UPI0004A75E86|nr:phosphoribosylamine--glycine ligase [Desulfohalovibrio reitneri]
MHVLLVGSGGREHALAWKLSQSPLVDSLSIAPGNPGTAEFGRNVDIDPDDIRSLVDYAKRKDVGLCVPGPELPLTKGLANALHDAGIPCFGPTEFCARLEGSKAFAKEVMLETGVPTAHFASFEDFRQARDFVRETGAPLVIKADGLASGKGVIICESVQRAEHVLEQVMVHKEFGGAGDKVVIEELLVGEEVSFLAFCDGETSAVMPTSQDHKPVGEGDTGPNTGGMGAYSPAHILPEDHYETVRRQVIDPVLSYMRAKGHPFVGVLYAGLIITADGAKVLEYNVRFGDPECQPLMMRLDSDLAEIMLACTKGGLNGTSVSWKPETALSVVLSAKGYPGPCSKGMRITGIERAEAPGGVKVFQAGTDLNGEGNLVTSGGRVLNVTALGKGLERAREAAYKAVEAIDFEEQYCRFDIGQKGLKWEPEEESL